MKIQTNTAANSALMYMGVNNMATERSIQRLSSGFRINRAADDAAGLAIANQLRADTKTLGQAQKNAAQAASMLQVADGAAQTLGTIFDRMRELASQGASANVGSSSTSQKLQDEWNALYSEADRIITSTKYQGTNVLTGLKSTVTAAAVAGTGASAAANTTAQANSITSVAGLVSSTYAQNGQYSIASSGANVVLTRLSDGQTSTVSATPSGGKLTFSSLGVDITTSGSYVATSASAAVAGTAGTFSDSTFTAAGSIPNTLLNGTYTVKDGTGANFGKLEIWTTGAGAAKIATSNAAVTTGSGSVTFDNNMTLTRASFTQAVAAASASSGTVTPGAGTGASTYTAAASTIQNTSANGTYTINSSGGNLTLTKGGVQVGNTITQSTLSASGTADFGNGITLTLGSTFSNSGTALNGLTFAIANATAAVSAAASSGDADTFVISGQTAAVVASTTLDGAKIDLTGFTAATVASTAPSILVGTSASQGVGSYAVQDSIGLDVGTLDAAAIKNLSATRNYGAGGLATGADLTSIANSQDALTRLDSAESVLNTYIGKLGAAESRVDYASQNVSSMLQNTQAAESTIRDADMAYEMTQFTKNNILQQAAQSMLSQANQVSQSVLQLLRS